MGDAGPCMTSPSPYDGATSPEDWEGKAVTITLWHNPRCGKSRQTLELLRSKGVEQRPVVVSGKRAAIGRPPEAVLPLVK